MKKEEFIGWCIGITLVIIIAAIATLVANSLDLKNEPMVMSVIIGVALISFIVVLGIVIHLLKKILKAILWMIEKLFGSK